MVHVIAERLMGTVDVRRDQVEEWLLPAPLTTAGDAPVLVSSFWTVEVECLAPAPVVPTAAAPTSASGLLAEAIVEPFGSAFAGPLALASAVVEFDNTGSTDRNLALRFAIAEVEVSAPGDQVVEISGVAGVLLTLSGAAAVSVTGDSEVEFTYYGDGNFPVFPFSFPALFTTPLNIQDAAALVEPTGVGTVDAVAGFAEVVLPEPQGSVAMTRKGSTPIFPWFFPVVFDDLPANVNLGAARLGFDMSNECAPIPLGECAVVIDAQGPAIGSAVLPWTFPVILIGAA